MLRRITHNVCQQSQLRRASGASAATSPAPPASARAVGAWLEVSVGALHAWEPQRPRQWVESAVLPRNEPPCPSPQAFREGNLGVIGTVGGIVAATVVANEALNGKFSASEAKLEERLGASEAKLGAKIDGLVGELKDQGARMQAKFDQEDNKFFQLLLKQSKGPKGDGSEGDGPSS